jgi:hypothetical protein
MARVILGKDTLQIMGLRRRSIYWEELEGARVEGKALILAVHRGGDLKVQVGDEAAVLAQAIQAVIVEPKPAPMNWHDILTELVSRLRHSQATYWRVPARIAPATYTLNPTQKGT